MSTLYIYGGAKDKKILSLDNHKILSYNMGLGNLLGNDVKNINDSKLLNHIALKHKEEYAEFVYSQNKKFVSSELIFDKNLSLYFLSDFSCKRSELFSTYSDYCNILLLKDYVNQNSINKIILEKVTFEFGEAFSSIIVHIPIEINELKINRFKVVKPFFKNILFFSKVGTGILLGKLFARKKSPIKKRKFDKVFLTRYPLHLNKELRDDKYGNLAKNEPFLVNLFTDDFHQKIGLIEFIQSLKYLSSFDRVCILDSYLSISDIWKSFASSIFVSRRVQKLVKEEFILNGVNLSCYVSNEILFSVMRIPRLLMWKNSIERFFTKYEISSLYYYLHEYPYGRLFTYVVKSKFPQTQLVGFQHGPCSKRKMLYMAAKNELSSNQQTLYSFPIPDKVLAEDSHSADIYRNSGYNNVKLMKKIYRLSYLSSIKHNDLKKNTSIIAPGLHDGMQLMSLLKKTILDNHDKKYILKVHPRADNSYTSNFLHLNNLQVSQEDIHILFSIADRVYATYSSVAIEAALLKIDVEILDLPGKINESPIYDEEFVDVIDNLKY